MTLPPEQAAALPQVRVKRAEGMQRARISRQMKAVLVVMAYEGRTVREAALQIGWDADSAVRAFNKSHVKQAFNQLVSDIRTNAGQLAYLRINEMAKTADSEHVRLSANQWIAGVDHIAPVKKVVGNYTFNHSFGGFDYSEVEPIEGEIEGDGES